jgi:predicted CopG family antitoxin
MRKKLTITVANDVYEGLYRVVGPRHISEFLEALARPHVIAVDLDEGYAAMAADEQREREAREWAEAGVTDVAPLCGEDDAAR